VLKTANLPVPTLNSLNNLKVVVPIAAGYSTFDMAKLIVAQHPSFSFEGRRRTIQEVIARCKRYDFDSDAETETTNSDFCPKKKSGTDYYSFRAVKEIFEYMDYEVIPHDGHCYQY
jgi:hypothetical protein